MSYSSTVREIILEAASYLGVESGTIPRSEAIEQAKAQGYDHHEADSLIPNEPSLEIPERCADTFGATWDVTDSGISFHGENESDPDTEPLDGDSEDHYGFQEPIATDVSDIENDLYTDGETAVDAHEAVGRYIGARSGEQTSAEKHGYTNTLQRRAKRRYYTLLEGERMILREFDNPTLALISLRMSPQIPHRVDLLNELQESLTPTLKKLRYQLTRSTKGPQLDASDYQYAYVIAGTEHNRATPHAHLLVYTDSDTEITAETYQPVVDTYLENNQYADGNGHRTDSATISIRGNNSDGHNEIPRATDNGYGDTSQAALYVANQIPHLPDLDGSFDELLHGAICHSTHTSAYVSSRGWPANVGDGNNSDGYNEPNTDVQFEIGLTQ